MSDHFVHETATVEKGAVLGKGTKVWHYAHVRQGAVLGKNCTVGHCGYVGVGVMVGNNVKIENKSSVFQGVTVEDDVFIGPHVAFTNDMRPRVGTEWKLVKTRIEKGVSIGANSTIVCGTVIGKYAMIGAGSVVTESVPEHGLVYGNPARLRGFVCTCGAVLGKGKVSGGKVGMKCPECRKTVTVNEKSYSKL
jgi:acetyltransferase-like isoleucine patch superfamily enzyme